LRARDVPGARHHARCGRSGDRSRRRRDHAGSGRRHDAPLSLGPRAALLRVRARRRARRRGAGPFADVGSDPSLRRIPPPRAAARAPSPLPLRRELPYRVRALREPLKAGVRVRVPFAERALTGVVTGPAEDEAGKATREILAALDLEPVCSPELLATAARV